MDIVELLDNLVPDTFIPDDKDYIKMYEYSLKALNELKLSRYKAMYFGSLQVGPDMYSWKGIKDFTSKYQSCCIYIMNHLYSRISSNNKEGYVSRQEYIELSICILYSMLSMYMTNTHDKSPRGISSLLKINDTFCNDDDLENEFRKEEK